MAKKNKVIILFNDVGEEFIKLYFYQNDYKVNEELIKLNNFELENGFLISEEGVASRIKELINDYNEAYLLVNSHLNIKSIFALPNISNKKKLTFYQKDLKDTFPNYKDNYLVDYYENKTKLGSIFHTNLINSTLISSLKKVVKLANLKLVMYNLLDYHMYNYFKHISKSGCFYYQIDSIGMFSLIDEGQNISFISFLNEENEIKSKFLSFISKREIEIEKLKLDIIYTPNLSAVQNINSVDIQVIDDDIFNKFVFKGMR